MNNFFSKSDWQPPKEWLKVSTIELHAGGEPLRVFTSGLPEIIGRTVLEKRRYFREHYDYFRTGTMWEPRGHADMYGAVVTPSEDADLDVFFLHNEGYSTMCGHAIIALTTLVFETGLFPGDRDQREIEINVPAGRIRARASIEHGRVKLVSFKNVPSFLYLRDGKVEVSDIGMVDFDIAYGGAFYALVESEPLGLTLSSDDYHRLIDYGRKIKRAVMEQFPIRHPFTDDLSFLYGTIFTGRASEPEHHSRNVCVFAEREVDRSATGSGVSARAASHFAKGELSLDQQITIESIVGSTMTVQAVQEVKIGPYDAIVPEVSGTASIIGRSEFYFDPADPFARGFILR